MRHIGFTNTAGSTIVRQPRTQRLAILIHNPNSGVRRLRFSMRSMHTDGPIGEDWRSHLEKPQPKIKVHCKVKLLVERSSSIPHCPVPEDRRLHNKVPAPSQHELELVVAGRRPSAYFVV